MSFFFFFRFAQPFLAAADRFDFDRFLGAGFLGTSFLRADFFRAGFLRAGFLGAALRLGAIGFDRCFLARCGCGVRARVALLRRFFGFRFFGICRRSRSVQYLPCRPGIRARSQKFSPP